MDAVTRRVKTREVFGRPLAEFLLTQVKLADMSRWSTQGFAAGVADRPAEGWGKLVPAQISVGKLNNVHAVTPSPQRSAWTTENNPVFRYRAGQAPGWQPEATSAAP